MSKSTLYTYFKSKLEILKVISTKQNIAEKFYKTFEGYDYPEALEEFYNMMIEIQDGLKVPFELLTLSSNNNDLSKIYREEYNEKLEAFQIFLQDQQEKGTIRNDVPADTLAHLLMALSTDISMQMVIGFNETKIHEKWTKSYKAILKRDMK
jgi:AcrR family transcriptional regulator